VKVFEISSTKSHVDWVQDLKDKYAKKSNVLRVLHFAIEMVVLSVFFFTKIGFGPLGIKKFYSKFVQGL